MSSTGHGLAAGSLRADQPSGISRLWRRELEHYPDKARRTIYLAITVLATVMLYWELYVQNSVAPQIMRDYNFTFTEFVFVSVISNLIGAFASLFAGLADRWGRANLIVIGLVITGVLTGFVQPATDTKLTFTVVFAIIGFFEGIVLVATPALVRDFSPQVGRGTAMGFWTFGPVLGSLAVTVIATATLQADSDWRSQYYICGAVGLVVSVIALIGLRELAPRLRDQLMVSERDRALIEARAAGIDPEKALENHWRQMLRPDIVVTALAISVYLVLYYTLVTFQVTYFQVNYGYTEQHANSLGNWYWGTEAVALVLAGVLSDRLRVRKPLMFVGSLVGLVGTALLAVTATKPGTSYDSFVAIFIVTAVGTSIAYVTWMAAFTETVEKHNPAATATGLAVWGWILRIVVTVCLAILPFVLSSTTTLVEKGDRVSQIVQRYPDQVAVLSTVDPGTLQALDRNGNDQAAQARALAQLSKLSAAQVARVLSLSQRYKDQLATAAAVQPATLAKLSSNPNDQAAGAAAVGQIAGKLNVSPAQAQARLQALGRVPAADLQLLQTQGPRVERAGARLQALSKVPAADIAYLSANGAKVQKAAHDNPVQWRNWWWVCFVCELLFLPSIFLLTGRWSPRRAREDAAAHEAAVQRELEALAAGATGGKPAVAVA